MDPATLSPAPSPAPAWAQYAATTVDNGDGTYTITTGV